jgi:hypothetical protein
MLRGTDGDLRQARVNAIFGGSPAQTPEVNGHAAAWADAVEAKERPTAMARPTTVLTMVRVLVRIRLTPLSGYLRSRAYSILRRNIQHISAP